MGLRAALRRFAFACALLAVVSCGRSEPDAPLPLPRALSLPASGTIGDLPPADSRLLVTIDAEGTLALDGEVLEILDLVARLAVATEGAHLREPDGSSRLDVLIAVDASVPWKAIVWVLMAAAHPRVAAYRTSFVVRPERSGEVGALAAFRRKLGPRPERAIVGTVRLVRAEGPPPDAAALENAITDLPPERRPRGLEIQADGTAAFGQVVSLIDAAYRAGVEDVVLDGIGVQSPKAGESIQVLVTAARVERPNVTLLWEGKPLPPPSGRRAFPTRVEGHPAGLWHPPSPSRAEAVAGGEKTVEVGEDDEVEDQEAVERRHVAAVYVPRRLARPPTPDPAERALEWLAAHQAADGGWEERGHARWCNRKLRAEVSPAPETIGRDVFVTGLALQAFLSQGYTNRGQHPFATVVSTGLRWLKNATPEGGMIGDPSSATALHDHAVAALAMVEAYGMTESPIFKGSAQRALDVLAAAHDPRRAWGRGSRGDPEDLATTAWVALVLCSAQAIVDDAVKRGKPEPLTYDRGGLAAALAFVERLTDASTGAVRDPAGAEAVSEDAATAMGAMVRLVAGEDPKAGGALARALAFLASRPPKLAEDGAVIDPLAVLWGAFATFHSGGDPWRAWNPALTPVLTKGLRTGDTPCEGAGAYDPADPSGLVGGRLATTALLSQAGAVYYRYDNALPCAR